MQKTVVKYSMVFLLALIYINRGLFVTAYEVENQENKEANSVIEWIAQLVTGESNDIDEDGDLQTDCNSVKIVTYDFHQEYAQYLDLLNLHSKSIEKTAFPNKENIPPKSFCVQIDHPPEPVING